MAGLESVILIYLKQGRVFEYLESIACEDMLDGIAQQAAHDIEGQCTRLELLARRLDIPKEGE